MQKITDFGLSNDNIKSIASAETKISGLKEVNTEKPYSLHESTIQERNVTF